VSTPVAIAVLFACMVAAALFSGSETGLYSLSRLRVEADARRGIRSARWIRRLLRDDAGMLSTLLVGNTLALETMAHAGRVLCARVGVPERFQELALTLALTPFVFFLAELLPKDLFRRRPHALLGFSAPIVSGAKVLLYPLTLPIRGVDALIERALGLSGNELARVQGRESVLEMLEEGETTLLPHVENMARNVLELRAIPLERVMIPWPRVECLVQGSDPRTQRERLHRTAFSRLPVVDARGRALGYVHLLEALAAPDDAPEAHLRPLLALEPSLSIDRALARLRAGGQRAAVVGTPQRPLGLVTLKDIVEEISGELTRW
jgi:CBS domain containing-hemolysin-like protein